MTRRNEPQDRVDELSNASVPFKFDVHAFIQTDDAPSLEHLIHQGLDDFRMNKVNLRREFFKVSISDIDTICKELGVTVSLTQLAEAREYRDSIELQKKKKVA